MQQELATAEQQVGATQVPDGERTHFLMDLFGSKALIVENSIFTWLDRLCPAYHGGYWEFFRLPDGGGYMAPSGDSHAKLHLEWPMNMFDGDVSHDAAGIIVCLYALSHLMASDLMEPDDLDRLNERYHQLYAYVEGHPEAGQILSAID